jgi:glycosyltransferase involved in cell wall biosynthesis
MTLGIDASRYGHSESTGVEWYSWHLLNELIPLLGREHNTNIRLYSPTDFNVPVDLPFNVKKRIIPLWRSWTIVRLSLEMITHPIDELFVPSHTMPLVYPKKTVVTIHDVAFRKFKHLYSLKHYLLLEHSTRQAVNKGWKIIVPSEATKKDLMEFFGCREDKIHVIPHGAPEIPRLREWSNGEKQKILSRFGLKEKDLVVLFVGRLEAKKNLCRLIEGFERFTKEFPDWKLVLAGKPGVGYEDIIKAIEARNLGANVILPGYISEREKMFLMDICRIFAMPSLYEGFGLPVLEAFAHKRPILTSNTSSLPEVAGNAAYLVNPEKVEEISVGLKRLASDGMLVNTLVQRGEQRLAKYSWEKAAKETFEVLFG